MGLINKVTVIIVNRRTPELTKACLDTLLKFYPEVKIVLVDNWSGKGDPSLQYVKAISTKPSITAVYNTSVNPTTHAVGLNMGLPYVQTPYFLTMDSDVTMQRSGLLELMLAKIEENPKTFVAGQLYKNADESCCAPAREGKPKYWYVSPFCAMWSTTIFRKHKLRFVDTGQPACSACIMAKKLGYLLVSIKCIHAHNEQNDANPYILHTWGGTRTALIAAAEWKRKKGIK